MKTNTNSKKTLVNQVVALVAVLALPSLALAATSETPTRHVAFQQDRADVTPQHPVRFNAVDGQPIRD